jgi:RNA polymerase-binding transcription factor DksA
MASGWANDGAIHDQIDATIKDAVERAKNKLPTGESNTHCIECNAEIPLARQLAIKGVNCQCMIDSRESPFTAYNRRGSKDSQLR